MNKTAPDETESAHACQNKILQCQRIDRKSSGRRRHAAATHRRGCCMARNERLREARGQGGKAVSFRARAPKSGAAFPAEKSSKRLVPWSVRDALLIRNKVHAQVDIS